MKNHKIFQKAKPIFQKWKEDYAFQTIASSVFSFAVTVLFALYNGFLGIHLMSVWHGSICVFYFLLALIRGIILQTENSSKTRNTAEKIFDRYKTFVISTTMLLLLNLALICPIVLMARFKKPVNVGNIPAIAMAAYTTCKITMASIHIHKQKHKEHNNILVGELRAINFIDALVSILTLQNTLIMENNTETNTDNMLVLTTISSIAIYVVIVFITIRLLIMGMKQHGQTDSCSKS